MTATALPGSVDLALYSGNAGQISFTFPDGYNMAGPWTCWLGDHVIDLVPTIAGQVVTVSFSAAQTIAQRNQSYYLHLAQQGTELVVPTLYFSPDPGPPTSASLVVSAPTSVNVTVDISSVLQSSGRGGLTLPLGWDTSWREALAQSKTRLAIWGVYGDSIAEVVEGE